MAKITGGSFDMDMVPTLTVEDISLMQVPMKKLTGHLKSDDFLLRGEISRQ